MFPLLNFIPVKQFKKSHSREVKLIFMAWNIEYLLQESSFDFFPKHWKHYFIGKLLVRPFTFNDTMYFLYLRHYWDRTMAVYWMLVLDQILHACCLWFSQQTFKERIIIAPLNCFRENGHLCQVSQLLSVRGRNKGTRAVS